MDYQIAIPSYQRPKTLRDKTLSVLERAGIDLGRVTVFVADTEQEIEYREALGLHIKTQVAVLGMREVRNYIQDFYPVGTLLMCFDDDIGRIERRVNSRKTVSVVDLDAVIQKGFSVCGKYDCSLWGVYPLINPYFMSNTISLDLRYIEGAFWGVINDHDPQTHVTMSCKEDFERTILYYLRDGRVARLNHIGFSAEFFSKGGMSHERTMERSREAAKTLVNRYPDLCQLKQKKGRPWPDLRLRESFKGQY